MYPDNLYELSYVGQDVQCVCRHNLTGYDDTLPRWKINDKMYLSTGLPSPFEPRNREQYFGISFTSIKKINHTTIRCCYFPNTEDTCSSVFTIRIAGKYYFCVTLKPGNKCPFRFRVYLKLLQCSFSSL